MVDADSISSPISKTSTSEPQPDTHSKAKSRSAPSSSSAKVAEEDFAAIYLRKVTGELGDELIKVREAPDFKSSSLPMLIRALKQGQSMYAVEEKRRVVGAATG